MPSTPTLALPYPDGTVLPDGPLAFQNLAEAVDNWFNTSRPRVGVYQSALQSIPNNVATALTWDTEGSPNDVGAMHSTVTNPTRITFTKVGLYLVTSHIEFGSFATGFAMLQARYNGTNYEAGNKIVAPNTSHQIAISTLFQATAVTDYIELICLQTTGAAKSLTVAAARAVWLNA